MDMPCQLGPGLNTVEPECWEVENHGRSWGVSRSGRALSAQSRLCDSVICDGGDYSLFFRGV